MGKKEPSRSKSLGARVIYEALKILSENGDRMSRRLLFSQVASRVPFDEWALQQYEKTGYIRWESMLHFFSIDCVKAGFIEKKDGWWLLTNSGKQALNLNDIDLLEEAIRLYREWKKDALLLLNEGGRNHIMEDDDRMNIVETESDIIEELEETEFYDEEDREDDGNPVKGKIYIDKKDFTLREYQAMRNDGDLILQPSYQRKFVADSKFASRLIESIILDVPIPAVFLAEEADGKYSVIDGQQRLTSFIAFLDGFLPDEKKTVFKLTGTKELSAEQGKGKTFAQIDDLTIQNKIKTTSIQAVIIKNSSNEDLKFAIFERLNTGSVKLNEDELRNTIYRGSYINLLSQLEQDEAFHSVVKKESFRRRMIYRGMILRFFALSDKSHLRYKSSMKQFCNKELRDNRHMVDAKKQEYVDRFNKCVDLARTVFGANAFKRYLLGDEGDPNGKWVTTRLNMAIFDIQLGGFVEYSKNQIVPKADEIREKLLDLMTNDADFMNTVENKTNDTDVLKRRFDIWLSVLRQIVGSPVSDPRIFKFHQKKKLFDLDPSCKICSQQILMIEDAEVDHIIPFSKGGRTEIENGQIAHRFCNRAKNNRSATDSHHEDIALST